MLPLARKPQSAKRLGGVEVKARILILTIAGSLAFSGLLWAHHGSRQVYQGKSITLRGIVTGYEWANPHSILSVAVKDDNGKVDQWHAEILPPSEMVRAGWNKDSLSPGDEVTVTGRPGKYEQHIMWLEYLVTSDGRKLGRNPQSP
jgi:Family of unknown function (DUF6152)